MAQRRRAAAETGQDPTAYAPGLRPPPRPNWKWALAAVVLVVVVASVRGATRSGPVLAANCTHPAIAVSPSSVSANSATLIRWSATGPAGQRVVVAVGADALTIRGDQANLAAGSAGQVASSVQSIGHNCLVRGGFGITLPVGQYRVKLFEVGGANATPVASTSLAVTR
jgi:hypothetical protein